MSKRMMAMFVAAAVGLLQPASGPVLHAQAREGIRVRAHWVIDVKNADGTAASRIEFDNALVTEGQDTLAGVLMGGPPISGWKIRLTDSGAASTYVLAEKVLENASVVLKASQRLSFPRTLTGVGSATCNPGAANCASTTLFSIASVPSPILVQQDQTVDIKVTISFAPAPH